MPNRKLFDFRILIVGLIHLAALIVLPGGYRWLLATAFPVAALLAWYKPDDRDATLPLSLGMIGAVSAICIGYRILFTLALDTPDPEGALLYSLSIWALGLAGVTYLGYLIYVARFAFWERSSGMYGPRARISQEVIPDVKRIQRR